MAKKQDKNYRLHLSYEWLHLFEADADTLVFWARDGGKESPEFITLRKTLQKLQAAYDAAARQYGRLDRLNFPDEGDL